MSNRSDPLRELRRLLAVYVAYRTTSATRDELQTTVTAMYETIPLALEPGQEIEEVKEATVEVEGATQFMAQSLQVTVGLSPDGKRRYIEEHSFVAVEEGKPPSKKGEGEKPYGNVIRFPQRP